MSEYESVGSEVGLGAGSVFSDTHSLDGYSTMSPLGSVGSDTSRASRPFLPMSPLGYPPFRPMPLDNPYPTNMYMNYNANLLQKPQSSVASSPKPSGLHRSYSIESLAKSSCPSEARDKESSDQNTSMDMQLSPLSSPEDLKSPKFSISTLPEDIQNLFPPKKQLNESFSISSLSVSSVTPSRVHCS